jgi:hypothetical protein
MTVPPQWLSASSCAAKISPRLIKASVLLLVSFFAAREDSPSGDLFSPQASGIWNLEFGLRLRRAVFSVARKDPTQRSLRGSVCSVLKLEKHRGHGECRFALPLVVGAYIVYTSLHFSWNGLN